MTQPFCRKCGSPIRPDQQYCLGCGAAIEEESPEHELTRTSDESSWSSVSGAEHRAARQRDTIHGKRSSVPALLAIGVVAIVAMGVLVAASGALPFELTPSFLKQQTKRLSEQAEQVASPSSSPAPQSGEGELKFSVLTSKPGNEVQNGDTIDVTFHRDGSFVAPFSTHGTTKYWQGTYSFSTTKDLKLTGNDNNIIFVTLNTDGTFSWMKQGGSTPTCTGQYSWAKHLA